jgi:hypothetical protein
MKPVNSELRKKLLRRKKELKDQRSGGSLIFFKADTTTRLRALPVGETSEPGREVVYFYLGQKVKGVISPATFGEPCAIMEYYNKLVNDKDDGDKELINTMKPKQRFVLPVIAFKDLKGKVVDESRGAKLALLNMGQYQDLIDLFLDSEDWGDFTDVKEGYDLKFTRVGSGQYDTEYSTKPCQKGPCPIKYRKIVNMEEMIRKEIPSYQDTKSKLKMFLGESPDSTDSIEGRKKVKKKSSGGIDFKKKMKKKSSDL